MFVGWNAAGHRVDAARLDDVATPGAAARLAAFAASLVGFSFA
jgi:hypothetical protein